MAHAGVEYIILYVYPIQPSVSLLPSSFSYRFQFPADQFADHQSRDPAAARSRSPPERERKNTHDDHHHAPLTGTTQTRHTSHIHLHTLISMSCLESSMVWAPVEAMTQVGQRSWRGSDDQTIDTSRSDPLKLILLCPHLS